MAEKRASRPVDLEASDSKLLSHSESENLLHSSLSSDIGEKNNPLVQHPKAEEDAYSNDKSTSSAISKAGLQVLILLAVQNCSKNLLMRYVMKDQPQFLTSAAVIGVEAIKLVLCVGYIIWIDQKPLGSIFVFLKQDYKNSILMGVPAAAYSFQMSLEYVALANLNAAMFSVLVQCKLLFTATFAAGVLGKKLKVLQVLSLLLLTTGVMLCNLQNLMNREATEGEPGNPTKGVLATLGIALSSGFASVYTEKVIKAKRPAPSQTIEQGPSPYGLAYTQVQLALVSLIIIGAYAMVMDFTAIVQYGLWHNFTAGACLSVFNSAIGGLIVAAGTYNTIT